MASPDAAPSLLKLPPELLANMLLYLPYPDILSFQLAHPHFYHSPLLKPTRTASIRQKIDWLLDRKERGLPCPEGFPPQRPSYGSWSIGRRLEDTILFTAKRWLTNYGLRDTYGGQGGAWGPALQWARKLTQQQSSVAKRGLNFSTDADFTRNVEVVQILRWRRRHGDCGHGQAKCEVVTGATCGGLRPLKPSKDRTANSFLTWECLWLGMLVFSLLAIFLAYIIR